MIGSGAARQVFYGADGELVVVKVLGFIVAIATRYAALIIQFLVVVLISRTLPQGDAGAYFILFGIVSTGYCLAGFGLPDGLVRGCGVELANGRLDLVRALVVRAAGWTGLTSICGLLATVAVCEWFGLARGHLGALCIWLGCYAAIFFSGQALVAIGKSAAGSFFFYTSANLLLLFTTVPYVLLAKHPTLAGALVASISAAVVAGMAGLGYLAFSLRKFPTTRERTALAPLFKLGGKVAAGRLLQGSLYWIPTWAVGSVRGADDAAIIGAGGRLLIAATAVIAAFRFAVRSQIVVAATKGDWSSIETSGRTIATISAGVSILALVVVTLAGSWGLGLVFGPNYAAAAPILAVLLVGAIGESMGGPVDEVLKLTGRPNFVLLSLVLAVSLEALLAVRLAQHSIVAAAAAQSLAFTAMYTAQIIYLQRKTGILMLPYFKRPALKRKAGVATSTLAAVGDRR